MPFNDFFRSQPNFMSSTDFMLLLVKLLKAMIILDDKFYLNVKRLNKVKVISKCLISFL